MSSEILVGICGESTTYRDDFRGYKVKKIDNNYCQDDEKLKLKKVTIPVFSESHDTFQKLDYRSRIPFNALWREKEIVGTDLGTNFRRKCQKNVNESVNIAEKKSIELMSPAVNLDDEEDPEMHKLLSNYLYKSTVTQAAEDVWRNFKKNYDKFMDKKSFEDSASHLPLKIESIPVDFENAGKKWDSLQNRRLIDEKKFKEKIGPLNSAERNINLSEKSENWQEICRMITEGKKLRLPYEKLPLSYGGHRTSIALGVPLLKKKLSSYNPDLTVSQTLASRNS